MANAVAVIDRNGVFVSTRDMKKGDLLPKYTATIKDGGEAVDLTGYTVAIKYTHLQSGETFTGTATILDQTVPANLGKVEYAWVAGNTDLVGDYRVQFVCTKTGSTITYPTEGYFDLQIEDIEAGLVVLLNPYVTVEEVRAELKNHEVKERTTQSIIMAINDASRWADRQTQRDFFEHDLTADGDALEFDQYDDHVYGRELYLQSVPVIAISKVTLGATTLAATDYTVKTDGVLINLSSDWAPSRPDRLLRVNGRFGYAQRNASNVLKSWLVPTGIPGNVRTATRLAAAALSGFNRKEVIGLDGNKQEFIDRAIPKTAYMLLGDAPSKVMT